MSKRSASDKYGVHFAIKKLKSLGYSVEDLNARKPNYPNSDLRVSKGEHECYVQVKGKLQKKLDWMNVGHASGTHVEKGRLFNTAPGGMPCNVVMSVVMSAHHPAAKVRFFVFPVADANELFLQTARYHLSRPLGDGRPRSQARVELGTYVGSGHHNVSNVLDVGDVVEQRYENAFHYLRDSSRVGSG